MFNKTELMNYFKVLIEKDEVTNTLVLALKHKYYSVYNHCLNVCLSSYLLCQKMNLSDDNCIHVALGGLLHDLGKLNIPSKILYKYGELSPKDWILIKRHPVIGVNLLSNSKYLSKVYNSILYHHERYDGKGYCSNLREENIPLQARVIGICDSFDAMISYRNYRDALTLEEAKNELIKNKNTQFDGEIVEDFLEIIDDFYNEYYNTENPLYIKDFINTKEDNDVSTNWETIFDNIPDIGVILIDKHEEIKFCNKFAASIRNKNREEVVGSNFANLHKKHRNGIIKEKLSKVKLGEINGWERIMKRENMYVENKYIAIRNEDNKYEGMLMLTKDVSEQEKMLRLLERNIEYLNILVQGNNLLAQVYDLKQILKKALNVFNKIINIEYINIIIKRYMDINFYNVSSMERFEKNVKEYIDENVKEIFNTKDMKIELKRLNNKYLVTLISPLEDKNTAIIFIQTDMETEIGEREEKLLQVISNYTNNAIQKYLFFVEIEEKAIKDTLTGIYNRQHLETVLNSLNPISGLIGVIIADINNLKYINDTFGHLYGDSVIKTAAQILKKSIRKSDYVFRYGGDEFIMLAVNCDENDIRTIIKRINNNITNDWNKKQKNVELTMSIGYSMSSKNIAINKIIKIADKNMYMEKNKFHKSSKKYQNEMESIILSK